MKPFSVNGYRVLSVEYHRNGVAGAGFFTGKFKSKKVEYTFVIFPQFANDDESLLRWGAGHCAVLGIEGEKYDAHWFFEEVIKPAIEWYQKETFSKIFEVK